MTDPQLSYDLHRMRQRELQREAANDRLARAARQSGPRPEARVLLPLANAFIALGLGLRRRYQPGESLALVPLMQLAPMPASTGLRASGAHGAGSRVDNLIPVLAFQVIQCAPQHATSFMYWSLVPAGPSLVMGAPAAGLVCLAQQVR